MTAETLPDDVALAAILGADTMRDIRERAIRDASRAQLEKVETAYRDARKSYCAAADIAEKPHRDACIAARRGAHSDHLPTLAATRDAYNVLLGSLTRLAIPGLPRPLAESDDENDGPRAQIGDTPAKAKGIRTARTGRVRVAEVGEYTTRGVTRINESRAALAGFIGTEFANREEAAVALWRAAGKDETESTRKYAPDTLGRLGIVVLDC